MSNELMPVVSVRDGEAFTTSRDVAKLFGKQHGHVLRDIEAMKESLSLQIWRVWFRVTTVDQATGFGTRKVPAYEMTKDGFTLVAMGYSGSEALRFKLDYIRAYNEME